MKSLFEKISQSSDDLRTCRVKNAVDMLANANQSFIMKKRSELLEHINILENKLDLGATSTTDIATNLLNVSTENWVSKVDEIVIDIAERIRNLNVRIELHNSLFPNNPIEPISAEEDSVLSVILGGMGCVQVRKSTPSEKKE